jgi:hypothetical protein
MRQTTRIRVNAPQKYAQSLHETAEQLLFLGVLRRLGGATGRPSRRAAPCPDPGSTDCLEEPKKNRAKVSILRGSARRCYKRRESNSLVPHEGDTAMRVMVLIKATKGSEAGKMPSQALLADMMKFNEELVNAGIMVGGEGLHPSSKAKRVRFEPPKKTSVIDGPFSETKELVAGFWLWKVDSIEQAVDWARRIPNTDGEHGEVELRPVFEADDFGENLTPEIRAKEEELRSRIESKQ